MAGFSFVGALKYGLMTQLSPNPDTPRLPPARLSWLTVPLLVSEVYQGLSLLTLPFMGNNLNTTLADYSKISGMVLPPLSAEQISVVLWLSFFLTALLLLWLDLTRRAVREGKSWGRVSGIVLGILSLFFLPFGTLLGIVMLIGAFDRDVAAYTRR